METHIVNVLSKDGKKAVPIVGNHLIHSRSASAFFYGVSAEFGKKFEKYMCGQTGIIVCDENYYFADDIRRFLLNLPVID